jgi:hypothetical protein
MTNLYLINEDGNIKQGWDKNLSDLKQGGSHLKSIFNDDPKKCFENAIKKKAFSETRIIDGGYDYIMYMCSNFKYDFFKSKVTKTKWKVLR